MLATEGTMQPETVDYNERLDAPDKEVCETLALASYKRRPMAEDKA